MNKDQPLDLTVHALPRLDGSDVKLQRTRLGRWKMLLVLLICAAPVVASYLAYYVVRPQTRSVFGTLVEPQRPLPDLVGVAPDGVKSNLRALKGQWLLMTVSGGACEATCQQYLYMQRQLRESLGKDKDRVDRVWLINDDAAIDPALLPAIKGAVVLRVPPAELANWLAPQQGHVLAEHLYLVDPIGNWMMRFPAVMDLKGAAKAKRDIERVLRASASWDEAGR